MQDFSNETVDEKPGPMDSVSGRFSAHGIHKRYKNRGESSLFGHTLTLTREIVGSIIHLPNSGCPKVPLSRKIITWALSFVTRLVVFCIPVCRTSPVLEEYAFWDPFRTPQNGEVNSKL